MRKAEDASKNKRVLNELFEVSKFLADKGMVERYSEYLNKVLIKAQDSNIRAYHKRWKSQG